MGFDMFQSRYNYNEPCRWWSRDESDRATDDVLIMQRTPSGNFMAKEISPETLSDLVLADSFMFDKTNTTIKTPDNVWGMKNEDLVEYQGEKWIVVNVQRSKARSQNTFFANNNNCSHYWIIELRK